MRTDKLSQFIQKIGNVTSQDHPDFDLIDRLGQAEGFDPFTSRRAFFAAGELQNLREAEQLDGGDGSNTDRVKPTSLLLKVKKKS